VFAGAGAASSLVVSAGSEGAGASWGIGMAATMAMVTAMRVGGTYLKVSIVQGEVATRLPCKYFLVSTHCCTNTCSVLDPVC